VTQHEQAGQLEQPVAGDSTVDKSLHAGGITPDAEAVLQTLPPQQAEVIRSVITDKNSRVEEIQRRVAQERKALEQDVEYAGILRECMKDSDFSEFIAAREQGDLATFYRQKAGTPAASNTNNESQSSPMDSGAPSDNGDANVSNPDVAAMNQRLQALETERARLAQETAVQEFVEKHPDWEQYKALMISARTRLPSASLDDLYYAARGMMSDGQVPDDSAGAAANTDQTANPEAASARAQPPLPVGQPPGSTSPASPVIRSMADAMRAAKQTHGIDGELRVAFEG
jgi:hypothetical protein